MNKKRIDMYLAAFGSSTSTKNGWHMSQLTTSGKFQRFDYGEYNNMKYYGQATPPEINIEEIDVPVAMFVGEYDALGTVKDN